jgi:hypothetical protein
VDLRTKIAQEVPALCHEFGIARLGIFGSVARGTAEPGSDIDFFAEFDSPEPSTMPDRYFGFIEAASRAFDRPVQLLTPRMLRNPHLKRSVERDLRVIYG